MSVNSLFLNLLLDSVDSISTRDYQKVYKMRKYVVVLDKEAISEAQDFELELVKKEDKGDEKDE